MNRKIFITAIIFMFLVTMTGSILANNAGGMKSSDHPRIMLLRGEEKIIKKTIASNATWKKMNDAIVAECDKIIGLPPVEHIKIGRRLLDKSREALRRIFYLSYAYRVTGQEKYFERGEKELLAVSNFSDWNPTHFLDVAEMTMAVAIGYDWLYDKLPAQSRLLIKEAILKKGIEPSFDTKYNSWLKVTNNWNQVCNAGMTFGAIAIAEDQPELSKKVIDRALESIKIPMNEYKPNGGYPEGYGYWDYGTSFNVMFLSAIDKYLNDDKGLSKTEGFLQTAGFMENMTGVTGKCFNWSDAGLGGSLSPAMFWLAQKSNDLSMLWVEKGYLQNDLSRYTKNRLLPDIMIWGKDIPLDKVQAPASKVWAGQGASPVCLMRTSWTDPNGIYVGFKAGSASVNHAHMDVGSFVMEAGGVRWASDFGMQDYESLESKGIALFGRTQDAQRWTVFRLTNRVHNTLTVDNQLQMVKGYAKIDKYSDAENFLFALSDLSTVYDGQLSEVKRGVAIVDKKYVVVRDELAATGKESTTIRWTMLTGANVEITGPNSVTLTKDGKKLLLRVDSPATIRMKTWSTEPTTSYDAPNPGTILVGFECDVPAGARQTLQVMLIPETAGDVKFNKELMQW
jgi:hypothetical protein